MENKQTFHEKNDAARERRYIELKAVYICPVYGHTVLDQARDKRPVCGAKKELYKKF